MSDGDGILFNPGSPAVEYPDPEVFREYGRGFLRLLGRTLPPSWLYFVLTGWETVRYPTQDVLDAADVYARGGYWTPISEDAAVDLIDNHFEDADEVEARLKGDGLTDLLLDTMWD